MENQSRDLARLHEEIRACTRCPLHRTRTQAVCGEGNRRARLMLIAQAPGEREDREGRMFIGPSGKIFEELLESAGICREDVYLTNLLKCRLPKNRRPRQDEIRACSAYLKREILLVEPEILVPLGFYAARQVLKLFGVPAPQGREAFKDFYGRLFLAPGVKIFPLPHPSCILHNPTHKPGVLEKYRRLRTLWGNESV
ncbi:MAG: uracil-DNA glycosylase [Calditrichaceae bacterium]|nr:uracil-DNA glycosylase [Calditrichia bacterium]NUQ40356.1 uracil-DNA glycosylase [Calditrichaceae bacterium]